MSRNEAVWAITTYFDPLKSGNRLKAYREFRRNLAIPLIAVELSFDGHFDLLPGDADHLIQLRGTSVLWQKERLLNVALDALPAHCDTVAWLDCDLVFTRTDWADEARGLLDKFALIQPFSRLHYLGEFDPPKLFERRTSDYFSSFAARYEEGTVPEECFTTVGASRNHRYVPGGAWIARRETVAAHGMYDAAVVGSGDVLLLAAACSRHQDKAGAFQMSRAQHSHYIAWAERFHAEVQGRISFVEGDLLHLWHGDLSGRRYGDRYDGFHRFDFDPELDLTHAPDGVWRWNTDKPELHQFVRQYFELLDRSWKGGSRKEQPEENPLACAID